VIQIVLYPKKVEQLQQQQLLKVFLEEVAEVDNLFQTGLQVMVDGTFVLEIETNDILTIYNKTLKRRV
jgi:hypothetical protein